MTTGPPLAVASATEELFLRLFTPAQPEPRGPQPRYTRVAFPPGDLSFLQGIAPIGNRFHPAATQGPQGAPNLIPRNGGLFLGAWRPTPRGRILGYHAAR